MGLGGSRGRGDLDSGAEGDACLEMATILKLGCPDLHASFRLSADRIAAMLTGLIRRERGRVESRA